MGTRLPFAHVGARLREGVAHGVYERSAREGRARDSVDVQRLVVDDELRDLFHGDVAHALGLACVEHVDAFDRAVLHGHLDVEGSVLADA